jgi:hypothetical protein
MYWMPKIAKFPIYQSYICLNNILNLTDIPLEKAADICELMAWELHLVFHPTKEPFDHNLNRLTKLMSALDYREAAQEKVKQQYSALFKPLEYVPSDADLFSFAIIRYKMGCVYGSIFDHDYEAGECFQKAAELLSTCHNPDYLSIANLYGYAAYACLKQNSSDRTISFLTKAMQAYKKAAQNNTNLELCLDHLNPIGFDFFYPSPYPYVYIEKNFYSWHYSDLLEHLQRNPSDLLQFTNIFIFPDKT